MVVNDRVVVIVNLTDKQISGPAAVNIRMIKEGKRMNGKTVKCSQPIILSVL